MKSISTCDTCTHFRRYLEHTYGVCHSGKVGITKVPIHEGLWLEPRNVFVSENFGCIHWKPKEGFVPRFEVIGAHVYDNRTGEDLYEKDLEAQLNGSAAKEEKKE